MVLNLEPRGAVRAGRGRPYHRDMTSGHGRGTLSDGIVSDMFFDADNPPGLLRTGTRHLCLLARWLLRRSEPPPPGIGQRYQEVEQAAAQQRLLNYAAHLRPPHDTLAPANHHSGCGPERLR
jgi:hypothetical protein